MSAHVLTAAEVEAAARDGARELALGPGTVVTPLARDRATVLGVALRDGAAASPASAADPGPRPAGAVRRRGRGDLDVDRLALESRVRILARRALLRRGEGLGSLEELVAAVMERLSADGRACACGREAR